MWFYFLIHLDVRSLRQKIFILFSNEAAEKAAQSFSWRQSLFHQQNLVTREGREFQWYIQW